VGLLHKAVVTLSIVKIRLLMGWKATFRKCPDDREAFEKCLDDPKVRAAVTITCFLLMIIEIIW
jgi:hypothetical protein